ncbi:MULTISPECIES: hypothetical protein [unclassified Mesorhizobium]|uniref:hypothetical protein n=1 Tax=unclassified Mesorhizobium TaxID=325217 RepID=UPI000FCC0E93|nr:MULTISPECIES: hypothetical protein [unclassified Mesorhizobium]TGP24988.1 hypothetical protein EN874_007690 [Mesorhizobium sp. M1D.F.Ca.ET.231.01.1.1]TGP36312.1 hypothetical protein EN877_07690 [Mesorhizobium sp. M1D.F.Ca.ET.234.01.1.1]TGS49815.1 hypothetical protein EN827_07690 [Mesorhizobium sp. M1D.F.Ca.ET.184.01.1.1]TGS64526.1 hypothetical protein EN826_007690 [Mesorhizobium sp. M1D.F.Ca.ET.183.01.1.1]
MTLPNPNLGPFEGDNFKYCQHLATEFSRAVTSGMGADPAWHDGHAAFAHFQGFIFLAMCDAGVRGTGPAQIMEDLLSKVRPIWEALITPGYIVPSISEAGPNLTVLSGGKTGGDDPKGAT